MNFISQHNSEQYKSGYLELIIGPMFSGKTSMLINIYNSYKNIKHISVINHAFDNRYHDFMLSSHDKIMIPCLQANKLEDLWKDRDNNELKYSEIILINEGQFFEDIYEVVSDMLKNGKQIYVCGLDGDFERKKFGSILDLIPICDKVSKLNARCVMCTNNCPAIFSKRLTNETKQTVIGSSNYIAVCRSCYDT